LVALSEGEAMQVDLRPEEVDALRKVLGVLVVEAKSGEVGVMLSGMPRRFVGTRFGLTGETLKALDRAAAKLGTKIARHR
jgi:hypothetical protein